MKIIVERVAKGTEEIFSFIGYYLSKSKLCKEFGVVPDKARGVVHALINEPDRLLLIARNEEDSSIIGFMGGYVQEALVSDCLLSYDMGAFVHPKYQSLGAGKKILKEFLDWSKEQGAVAAHICTCFGEDELDKKNTEKLIKVGFESWGYLVRMKISQGKED